MYEYMADLLCLDGTHPVTRPWQLSELTTPLTYVARVGATAGNLSGPEIETVPREGDKGVFKMDSKGSAEGIRGSSP